MGVDLEEYRQLTARARDNPITTFACLSAKELEVLCDEADNLRTVLRGIVNDATGDISDPEKRLWPIRSTHLRRAHELLKEPGTPATERKEG